MGSGGVYVYKEKQKALENLHRELKVIISKQEECPASRYGQSGKLMYTLKQFVKKLLGYKNTDLYDLKEWIVFQAGS